MLSLSTHIIMIISKRCHLIWIIKMATKILTEKHLSLKFQPSHRNEKVEKFSIAHLERTFENFHHEILYIYLTFSKIVMIKYMSEKPLRNNTAKFYIQVYTIFFANLNYCRDFDYLWHFSLVRQKNLFSTLQYVICTPKYCLYLCTFVPRAHYIPHLLIYVCYYAMPVFRH